MPIFSKENKSAILGAPHLKTETVNVPEWGEGVSVIVSEMSGLSRDAFYAKKDAKKDLSISESQAALLIATVVDETGAPVLDEADVDSLRAQSSAAMDRLVTVAVRINGLNAGATEDAVKNSGAAQSGDSGSV